MSPNPNSVDLPDYERPPVVEIALSMQFAPLSRLRNIHAGLIWNELKPAFPKYQEHPALPPVFEVFGPNQKMMGLGLGPQIEFLTTAPVNRYWFLNESGSELVQIQQDRILYNWRKHEDQDVYPRYETIRANFAKTLEQLLAIFAANDLGAVQPNQCEVTYINYVTVQDGVAPRANLHRMLAPFSGNNTDGFLPDLEDLQMQLRFPIKQEGRNVGRLYVQIGPALRTADRQAGIQITLTARGKPRTETVDAAFELLDVGREYIVRGFDSITTPEMHESWGKRNGK